MLIYYTDHFVLPLPAGHRFPMRKYAALRERVAAIAGDRLRVPAAATDEELMRAHDAAYVRAACAGELDERAQRRIGFPWSPAMIERSRRSAGRHAGRVPQRARVTAWASTSRAAPIMRTADTAKASACSTTRPSRRARCRRKAGHAAC